MIERYEDQKIQQVWSNASKLSLWQKTDLAVLEAKLAMGRLRQEDYDEVARPLQLNPIDIAWWKKRDGEIHHDLNAFLEERLRFIIPEAQRYFHAEMTSYDTEEPAFVRMLWDSCQVLEETYLGLDGGLISLIERYRFAPMMARTHGQHAQVQSFGKRCLVWWKELRVAMRQIAQAKAGLQFSKLSGAIGNHGGLDADVERRALAILGLKPFYGATQIMPRQLYAPLSSALCQFVLALNKIALDIRLGARSGNPIYQEPFAKQQKGSSAMPHKKNTIATEQVEGMARMAQGFAGMIMANIVTWEERAIEQSSVERVAWPDLFHVCVRSAKSMAKVLQGLVVYPDHMLLEIVESRGCYASEQAKEFLKENGMAFGISTEDAYRIVQLAAFNAFEPAYWQRDLRLSSFANLEQADRGFSGAQHFRSQERQSIQEIIAGGKLFSIPDLTATGDKVATWNQSLVRMFADASLVNRWLDIFRLSYHLRNEARLYKEILSED